MIGLAIFLALVGVHKLHRYVRDSYGSLRGGDGTNRLTAASDFSAGYVIDGLVVVIGEYSVTAISLSSSTDHGLASEIVLLSSAAMEGEGVIGGLSNSRAIIDATGLTMNSFEAASHFKPGMSE